MRVILKSRDMSPSVIGLDRTQHLVDAPRVLPEADLVGVAAKHLVAVAVLD